MNKKSLALALTLLPASLIAPFLALAEQSQRFGDYVVHYNVVQTSFLTPKVARDYNIVRSQNRAMLNISVLKSKEDGHKAVHATVTASATNLNGQLKSIPMRAVQDGDSLYYLGQFGISDEEILDFTVQVRPESREASHTINFREQFFTR